MHGSITSTVWTYRLLGFFVGQKINKTKEECTDEPLSWFIGYNANGECHITTQNISTAHSPAFLIESTYTFKTRFFFLRNNYFILFV